MPTIRLAILSFMASACVLAAARPAMGSRPLGQMAKTDIEVTVCVAQVGLVSAEVQKTAQTTVRRLYSQIGIAVRFTNEPPQGDADAIALKVWERAPDGPGSHVMGSAWIGDENGRQANAFDDRVEKFIGGYDSRDHGIVLGYVIAHELGHILRAEPSHSPAGVMKTCWRQTDIEFMLQGKVRFTRADARRIHDVMGERRMAAVPTREN